VIIYCVCTIPIIESTDSMASPQWLNLHLPILMFLLTTTVVTPSNAVSVILSTNGVTLFGGRAGSVKLPPVPVEV